VNVSGRKTYIHKYFFFWILGESKENSAPLQKPNALTACVEAKIYKGKNPHIELYVPSGTTDTDVISISSAPAI